MVSWALVGSLGRHVGLGQAEGRIEAHHCSAETPLRRAAGQFPTFHLIVYSAARTRRRQTP